MDEYDIIRYVMMALIIWFIYQKLSDQLKEDRKKREQKEQKKLNKKKKLNA